MLGPNLLLATTIAATVQTVSIPSEAELRSLAAVAVAAAPEGSRFLAVCGPSQGWSYFARPQPDGWTEDGISSGRLVFIADAKGDVNLLFRDVTGRFYSATRDGGRVVTLKEPNESGEFAILIVYPSTGVTETYTLTKDGAGEPIVLSTATKPNLKIGSVIMTKISALTSKCFK
jgi:hypothetical protein